MDHVSILLAIAAKSNRRTW